MCVCAPTYSLDMAIGTNNTRFGVVTNHLEIWDVIGLLCLLVLLCWLRYAWKPSLEPDMDSGIWLCVGKVLGTPRHPSVDSYLPPCALVCVWSIKQKCWIIIKYKCLDVVERTSIGDARIRRNWFCYPLFPLYIFRVLGEIIAGYTWNPNTVH